MASQNSEKPLSVTLKSLAQNYECDLSGLCLDVDLLLHTLSWQQCDREEDQDHWAQGSKNATKAPSKEAYAIKVVQDRFKNYKKYWVLPWEDMPQDKYETQTKRRATELLGSIKCAQPDCSQVLNWKRNRFQRKLGASWHFDHM